MKYLLLTSFLFLNSFQLFSQNFEVPKILKLEKAEDYATYERDVINAVDWLLITPVTDEQDKRKQTNAFLMKWLTGSPTVTIELSQDIVTFMDCNDCLMLFLGGWAKYALETQDFENKLKGNTAGIEAVIEFYKRNKAAIGKNKAIEKYIKLQDKQKLEKHLVSKI